MTTSGTVYKLKELLGTRYIYISFKQDLEHVLIGISSIQKNKEAQVFAGNDVQQKLFDSVRNGESVVLDMCDCNITSDISPVIFTAQNNGVAFIDSADSYRDSILRENSQRQENASIAWTYLPEYDLRKSIVDYINSLSSDITYTSNVGKAIDIPLIIMITMLRPKINIIMDNVNSAALKMVSSKLSISTLEKYSEFYYVTPEGVEILKTENGKVRTQRLGVVSIAEASSGGYLVPTAFGKEVLYKQEGWDAVFKDALNLVNKARESRPRTLREVLVGE